jgi:hypothetical protein
MDKRQGEAPGPGFILAIVAISLVIWIPGLELLTSYERGGPQAVVSRLRKWGLARP